MSPGLLLIAGAVALILCLLLADVLVTWRARR